MFDKHKSEGLFEQNQPSSLTRRKFLRRSLAVSGGFVGGSLGYSLFLEPARIRVDRVEVPLPGLPQSLEGFTIAQLSDLHRGPLVSIAKIRQGVDLALSLKPDLIALTGDFVSRLDKFAGSCAQELSRLHAPHGVYAVLGNHDYWTRRSGVIVDHLIAAGAQVLVNAHKTLRIGESRLCVGGADDLWSGDPDLEQTFRGAPDEAFKLLLIHEPDFADVAAEFGIPLQISGHSHGGQVRLPGWGPPVLPKYGRKYPIGLQRVENSSTLVYTNRGLGCVFPPLRLNCPPEVTLLRLRRARS